MRRILITGSGGFLGSNLCNLLSKKHEVLAVSRKFDNIILNENIKCVKYDMTQYIDLSNKFISFMPEVVIHCAWEGGNSSKDIDEIWQSNNIISSNNLLKLCSEFKVKHFIGFGSCAEFGNSKEKIVEETACNPISMYGINKFSFKMISEKYCQDNEMDFSWVRPVYTYGPFDVETRLIPKVIKSLLHDEDIVLNACSAVVDYLYVEDFCKAVRDIVDYQLTGDYVISSDQEYQVKNIVQQIYNLIHPKSELLFDCSIVDKSPQYVCGSSQKLIKLTNWKPEVTLEEGLKKTIKYFQQRV